MNRKFFSVIVAVFYLVTAGAFAAEGIDCSTLPDWSETVSGYQVNQHHIFCGEVGKKTRAKGFHSMPDGKAPNTYLTSNTASGPNAAGVYTLKNIRLKFGMNHYTKSFSSMFPSHCSQGQVLRSIVYSQVNNTGNCASPGWAQCGPSAPSSGDRNAYCVGANDSVFTIASARAGTNRINTGFPIYTP